MQNCRTQRIPSEGGAERGGAVSTVAPGHRAPTSGRAAGLAEVPRRPPVPLVQSEGAMGSETNEAAEPGGMEEHDDEDDWNPCKAAGVCLMLMASCCEDDMISHSLPFVREHIKHPDWRYRDAAVMTFETVEEIIAVVRNEDQPSSNECDDNIASAVVPPD
ncbi:hypothetical protein HPB51_013733 [Rhipicephalus microplus]|uniref:Uncharacterized protein n=1 Tax=Rhipicephalus microplus TaxID=6941 RepID=A0A9J6F3F5_RHIMP|nr:hypothetical protein HPB51_013733 [Rhipicephalus microplus]